MKEFEPQTLSELVEYQSGGIVSKTIIDKEAGTVTLFAFDKGQGLSEHTAPFDALVYMADGNAEWSVSGEKKELKTGQIVILPANKPHAVNATSQFKMVLVMIRAQ
jgi:quercetin dioxygenase-like cupin family protein